VKQGNLALTKVEEYRGFFVAGSLILILIAAVPVLGLFIRIPEGSERFSELWLLDPFGKAESYPLNIQVGQSYLVRLGVGNHLGRSAYYRVYLKLRNQTQPLPTASSSSPSILPPLYEFDIFVKDHEIWERPLNFVILDASTNTNSTWLKRLEINGVIFQVDTLSTWDEKRSGFFCQLFLELWLYNMTLQDFQYHNRFVGIWLNVTTS
jgi:uncharacterized membrane protein